jgi:amino-acid N-acetyltransferase
MKPTSAESFSTPDRREVRLRRAGPTDHQAVAVLLSALGLPTDGVSDWLDRFWVAEHEGRVAGLAGMERYGDCGLLRSVAVAPEWRGGGIGRTLVDRVLQEGRAAGVGDVYLLTTTAEDYFPRFGFTRIDRAAVPAAVRASAEFAGACPASAVVMHRAATS